jgi:hypothetical protein
MSTFVNKVHFTEMSAKKVALDERIVIHFNDGSSLKCSKRELLGIPFFRHMEEDMGEQECWENGAITLPVLNAKTMLCIMDKLTERIRLKEEFTNRELCQICIGVFFLQLPTEAEPLLFALNIIAERLNATSDINFKLWFDPTNNADSSLTEVSFDLMSLLVPLLNMRTIICLVRAAPDYIVQNVQNPTACKDAFILKPLLENTNYDVTVPLCFVGTVVYCKDGCDSTLLQPSDFVAVFMTHSNVFDFTWACENGMVEYAKHIYTRASITPEMIRFNDHHLFRYVCSSGHLAVAKWLTPTFNITQFDVSTKRYETFRKTCANGHLETAQWLATNFELAKCDAMSENAYAFTHACSNGHVSVAEWLWKTFSIPNNEVRNISLRRACENGHLAVVRWIVDTLQIQKSDILIALLNGEPVFNVACFAGKLEVAQWMTITFQIRASEIQYYKVFKEVCCRGGFEMAKWVTTAFEITPKVAKSSENYAFRIICQKGNLEFAQWFADTFALTTTDVRAVDDAAFQNACRNGHLDVVKWLVDHFQFKPKETAYPALEEACSKSKLKLVRWLVDTLNLNLAIDQQYHVFSDCFTQKDSGFGTWFKYAYMAHDESSVAPLEELFSRSAPHIWSWFRVL